MIFDYAFAIKSFPEILSGVPMTLLVTVVSMFLGLVLGLGLTLGRIYKIPVLKRFAVAYISFVRGTPLLVQIYVIFFGLPELFDYINSRTGWHLPANDIPPLLFALIAFTINTSAYLAETIRSALQSIDHGQMEAAHSVGLTTWQGLKRIVIPQALVVALPSLGNIFLGLIKGTSLAYAVRVIEVLAKAKIIAGDGYQYLETYVDAAIIYWVLSFIFERIFFAFENRINRFRGEVTAF